MKRIPRPDDPDKPFIVRWNTLARILLVETSIKYVARAAMDFADYETGANCYPSSERLARETGYSVVTVNNAWKVLRTLGMAHRVAHGVPHQRLADEYQLLIPDTWYALPILGPHGRKFTCAGCGKVFNPQSTTEFDDKDRLNFVLTGVCFCAPPRAKKGRAGLSCRDRFDQREEAAGRRVWADLGDDRWKVFRTARGDDW
ncbi:hypothetical protein ABZ671_01285 [Micromonospora sp. NPDC006766]|uniref:hypothetical protein n=1 Tax=Micromonospora sp. NPDC006766 TaxID=3154778 RepID=UPI0033D03D56